MIWKPLMVPSRNGTAGRAPKATPLAISDMFAGPGEPTMATMNRTSTPYWARGMRISEGIRHLPALELSCEPSN